MKTHLLFICLPLLIMGFVPEQKKTKVVFFGDSITQMGVQSGGYIERMTSALRETGLSSRYQLTGSGVGGNKISDLQHRVNEDVIAQKPDVVFIWIGVNDVWHKAWDGGTDRYAFEERYDSLLQLFNSHHIKTVLVTPAVIGEKRDCTNPQDEELEYYANVVRTLSKKYKSPLVDIRKSFQQHYLKGNPKNRESGILTTDKVHLNEKGNQLVADRMLAVLLSAKL